MKEKRLKNTKVISRLIFLDAAMVFFHSYLEADQHLYSRRAPSTWREGQDTP